MKLKFKSKPEEAKKMVFGNKHKHVKPIKKIVPRSTSLFSPIKFNKPVKRYWGDYDGDGVINGLDCEPRNKFKQGPQHKKLSKSEIKKNLDFVRKELKKESTDCNECGKSFKNSKGVPTGIENYGFCSAECLSKYEDRMDDD